jgi:hypothetical protein
VSLSFASRRVALLLPPLPLPVQVSCFLISHSRPFQSFHDPNVSSSIFSFSRLSSADTIIADIISRASKIPLGKSHVPAKNYTKVLMI